MLLPVPFGVYMGTPELLRTNLLRERTIALAGGVRTAVTAELARLGAGLVRVEGDIEELDAGAWAAAHAPIHALVYDATASFAEGGADALRASVDGAWSAVHAVATAAFIPSGLGAAIVLLAPRDQDGGYANSVRAALENTSRTLSVEWARFGITTTVITAGAGAADEDIATLVAFLVSQAGGYCSGCRFELGAVGRGDPVRAPIASGVGVRRAGEGVLGERHVRERVFGEHFIGEGLP